MQLMIMIIAPTLPPPDKPWAEKYWRGILLICIGAVLVIGIVGVVIGVSDQYQKME